MGLLRPQYHKTRSRTREIDPRQWVDSGQNKPYSQNGANRLYFRNMRATSPCLAPRCTKAWHRASEKHITKLCAHFFSPHRISQHINKWVRSFFLEAVVTYLFCPMVHF